MTPFTRLFPRQTSVHQLRSAAGVQDGPEAPSSEEQAQEPSEEAPRRSTAAAGGQSDTGETHQGGAARRQEDLAGNRDHFKVKCDAQIDKQTH